ncbi:MAG: Crp/Fnr family transcriptional regulator [Oscillospiraceae bacterium]|nr:Crp/Fnr family transcriptional regulator [Oscillospiraceae bacterium]
MTEQNILEQFPILSELPGDKLRQVCAHFKTAPQWLLEHISVVRFPPDTIFIREGQPACDVYVVASGTVKAVEYRVLGVQYDFIQFTKVYALGGMEVLMDLGLYRTTLMTVEACIAIRIPRACFERWLMGDIRALKYEAKLMGEYLLEQGRLAREYMFLPGPERLAKLLIQKYETSSRDQLLVISGNRQALANETGFGIKTVNRAVKSLSDGGYITKQDRSILVNYQQYLSLKRLISLIIAPEQEDGAADEEDPA